MHRMRLSGGRQYNNYSNSSSNRSNRNNTMASSIFEYKIDILKLLLLALLLVLCSYTAILKFVLVDSKFSILSFFSSSSNSSVYDSNVSIINGVAKGQCKSSSECNVYINKHASSLYDKCSTYSSQVVICQSKVSNNCNQQMTNLYACYNSLVREAISEQGF